MKRLECQEKKLYYYYRDYYYYYNKYLKNMTTEMQKSLHNLMYVA